MTLRLGINIDHVATLRNARGGALPSVLRAAQVCKQAGADSITIHLREDRRHIRDADVGAIIEAGMLPVNLEMAATTEMLNIALAVRPHAVCIVPEKREELTTEGGLDVVSQEARIRDIVAICAHAGIRTSLFVDADSAQIEAAARSGARCVEIHTGTYSEHYPNCKTALQAIELAAARAKALGLEVHAGHGLTYENVADIAKIPEIVELNIGHFIIGEALFVGLEQSIRRMQEVMIDARGQP